jgi:hypothetical protein
METRCKQGWYNMLEASNSYDFGTGVLTGDFTIA